MERTRLVKRQHDRVPLALRQSFHHIAESFNGVLLLRDATGGFVLEGLLSPRPQVGDFVSLQGTTDVIDNYHQTHVFPQRIAISGHGDPPVPRLTDATRLSSGKDNFDLVKVRGFVSEIFKDENNADWNYLIVRDAGLPVYVSVPNAGALSVPLANLVDAEVEISGIALPHYAAHRMFVGPHLESWSKDCDGYLVPVDLSANPSATDGLSIGCKIETTGVCIMETQNWGPDNLFPVFGGFTLVIRTPDDIRVLSRPSWWTPGRLIVVICSLFAALLGIAVWNRVLNRLAEKRGRQLFAEQIAHASEALKVGERTRLAVELHDSLSQNLAGLACQITAAKSAIPPSANAAVRHLDTAERMLLSCRTELRRCLWDLRGDTLELDSMTEAIKKTILPVIGDAKLSMRFNVPRSRLLDSTAHSILCIIRELAANAIRHGQATQIKIAGEFHDDRLSFSVRDNGSGFDTANYAGLAEGHFGLEGIKERVERLDGSFEISSAARVGTRAEVALPIPGHGEQSEAKS